MLSASAVLQNVAARYCAGLAVLLICLVTQTACAKRQALPTEPKQKTACEKDPRAVGCPGYQPAGTGNAQQAAAQTCIAPAQKYDSVTCESLQQYCARVAQAGKADNRCTAAEGCVPGTWRSPVSQTCVEVSRYCQDLASRSGVQPAAAGQQLPAQVLASNPQCQGIVTQPSNIYTQLPAVADAIGNIARQYKGGATPVTPAGTPQPINPIQVDIGSGRKVKFSVQLQ